MFEKLLYISLVACLKCYCYMQKGLDNGNLLSDFWLYFSFFWPFAGYRLGFLYFFPLGFNERLSLSEKKSLYICLLVLRL